MNTLDIDTKVDLPNFLGAFAYNEIPNIPNNDFSLVINTDDSESPGDHWIPILRKKGVIYFLDSFGRSYKSPLFEKEFSKTISKIISDGKWRFNNQLLQDLFSTACGYYACYFILEMQNNSLREVLNNFTEDLKKNDSFVIKYVDKI